MKVNKVMDKLYDDVVAAISADNIDYVEVVEVKESIYRDAIKGEDHTPEDIFNQSDICDQVYFNGLSKCMCLLLKPVPDSEIETDFRLTTLLKLDVTNGNCI